MAFTLYMAGQTDTGRNRAHNEDAISWDQGHGLALLADGMGGHNAGDVASRVCLESLNGYLLPKLAKSLRLKANKGMSRHGTLVKRAIMQANKAICEAAMANAEYRGMGTTLVALLLHDDQAVVAHVGDSRIYRLRAGELSQLTEDHSLVQEMLNRGMMSEDEVDGSGYTHVVTRAMGADSKVLADIQDVEVKPGDVFLLCSDGLSDLIADDAIADTLVAASGNWQRACQHLIDLANHAGGTDNISVVLVAVGPPR